MLISDNVKYYICRDIKLRYVISLLIKERLLKRNKIILYYLYHNTNSIMLEKFSNFVRGKKGGNYSLHHYDCNMSNMKTEKGISIIKASASDDLNEIIDKLDRTELDEGISVFNCLDKKLIPFTRDLKLYVKQRVALEIYRELVTANVVCWLATSKESELCGKNPVFLISKKSYWSYLIADHLKSKGINFKFYFSPTSVKKNKAVLFIYHTVKLFVELTKTVLLRQRAEVTPGKAKIGISFYVFQNFTNYHTIKNYYLFWFYKSGIDPDDIVIYAPEDKSKISAEEVSNIRNSGFRILDFPIRITSNTNAGVPTYRCSTKAFPLFIQYIRQIVKMVFYAKTRFMLEQWKILSVMLIQLPYWEDFFQSNNIMVKFRFHDTFSVRDIAAKLSGSVNMSYHYSNHSDASVLRDEVSDIFFIWGKKYRNCLSVEHSTTRNLITSGYIFDYTFDRLKSRAQLVKDSFNNKVVYLIGIFSENLVSYLTKSQMRCYRSLLGFAVNNSDVGLIIKPKHERDELFLTTADETKDFVGILLKQGRIQFLSSNKYPVEAGLASNVVIGMIPDSTAALECALAGVPTVIYDCRNSDDSNHIYISGLNKTIFNNMEQLLIMISSDKENPGTNSISGFGDWSPILDTIDSFRDGKANQRIVFYIKELLCKLNEGLAKDEAIKVTNEMYASEYGSDKVISFHSKCN